MFALIAKCGGCHQQILMYVPSYLRSKHTAVYVASILLAGALLDFTTERNMDTWFSIR